MPNVGELAPDFELLNQDGKPVKLSDYRGKKVILFAYPKADTPGCTTQACGFRDEFPRITEANTVVLGLSPDSVADLKKWHTKMGFPYDLLADPEHSVLDAWGVWGEKSMYGKTYMGVTRSHWVIGEDGTLLDEQIKITPENSVAQALGMITL